jgi:hypothetical protein
MVAWASPRHLLATCGGEIMVHSDGKIKYTALEKHIVLDASLNGMEKKSI